MHYGQQSGSGRPCKVVESLLLDAKGELERIADGHLAGSILHHPADGSQIRDGKFALGVVVFVVSLSTREHKGTLHAPAGGRAEVESGSWQDALRNRIVAVEHFPGSQRLAQNSRRETVAEFML